MWSSADNHIHVAGLCKVFVFVVEFGREPKHSDRQIPESRSNAIEPRRSLADKISYLGETELFHKRSRIWRDSWSKILI